jgi:hypothetical protein
MQNVPTLLAISIPLATMVAEPASIVGGGSQLDTNRLTKPYRLILLLSVSFDGQLHGP